MELSHRLVILSSTNSHCIELNKTSFSFAGVAALLVFAVGLLATGKLWIGLGVLIFGLLAAAIAISPSLAARAVFAAIGALLLSLVFGYHALSNEINGTATYRSEFGRHGHSERVTREASPAKFREATNFLWAEPSSLSWQSLPLFTSRANSPTIPALTSEPAASHPGRFKDWFAPFTVHVYRFHSN